MIIITENDMLKLVLQRGDDHALATAAMDIWRENHARHFSQFLVDGGWRLPKRGLREVFGESLGHAVNVARG